MKSFTFRSYPPLKEGVEKKLMMDLKNVVSLTLADSSKTGKKIKQRRASAVKRLVPNPDAPKSHDEYCNHCANNLLAFVGEILRRE